MRMSATSPEAKERNRALRREAYQWYKSKGICVYCRTAYAEPGRVYCKACTARQKALRDRKDPGCEKRYAYNRERRAALIENGLCIWCGKRKPVPGQRMCPTCRDKDRESKQKYEIIQRIKREAQRAREANATWKG